MNNKVLETIDNAIAQLDEKNGGEEAMAVMILLNVKAGLLFGGLKPMCNVVARHAQSQIETLTQSRPRIVG